MFREILKKLSVQLDKNEIPYVVIGGQAVLLYGEPRQTKDIDITLGLDVDQTDRVLEVAKSLELNVLVEEPIDFVQRTRVLPLLEPNSGIRIDFIFSFSPFERESIERSNKKKLDGIEVNFASKENLIVHKIVADRPRDREDVKSILRRNPDTDNEYIIHWLSLFDDSLDTNYVEKYKKLIDN
ncbi:MAG: hypothetical protein GF372_07640 [Candidatus Marinimicrobia bacterium]|nr:hypothetical protein [Candidatus Neomarinimicrobiota bacterium]